jgi:hypothetical protein
MSHLRFYFVASSIALLLVVFGTAKVGRSMECQRDSISEVSQNGDVVSMLSGHLYEIDDTSESSIWLTAEDVLVCVEHVSMHGKDYAIYNLLNKDEGGDEVSARRLK